MTTLQQLSRLCSVYGAILFLPCAVGQNCQPECHAGHGICINGGCFCQSPWGGEDCGSAVSGSEDSMQPARPQALTSDELDEEQAPQTKEAAVEDRVEPASAAPETSLLDSGSQDILAASPLSLPSVLLNRPVVPSAPTEDTAMLRSQAINVPSPLEGAAASMERASRSAIPKHPKSSNSRLNLAAPTAMESIPSSGASAQDASSFLDETQTRSRNLRKARRIDNLMTRHQKTIYKLVGSVGDKDDALSKTADSRLAKSGSRTRGADSARTNYTKPHDAMLMRSFSLSAGIITTENCYLFPFIIELVILASVIFFLACGWCADYRHGSDDMVEHMLEENWGCTCCISFSRCLFNIRWQTRLIGLVMLVAIDAGWIYLCETGVAVKYIEESVFVGYIVFIALGIVLLILLECWFRVGQKRYRQYQELTLKVEHLVALLDVKYGKQLKEQKEKIADKLDDVTDFLGVTEASSDDDITCMEAAHLKAPQPKRKKNAKAREPNMPSTTGRMKQ